MLRRAGRSLDTGVVFLFACVVTSLVGVATVAVEINDLLRKPAR